LATAGLLEETEAVEGEWKGPVSSEQPGEVQPVAAGPTNVGEDFPKLDDVTPLASALDALTTETAAAPPKTTTSATVSDDSERETLLGLIPAPL
jgi:hypothetical protein